MLVDARQIPRDQELDCDLCIVGGGAVGITLARELREGQLSVCLLESGGLELDAQTQSLYEAETTGTVALDPGYTVSTRQRFFGGSTNHWTGMCRAMDDIDFEERPWVPNSGWPFSRKELIPYYGRAAELCEVTDYPADWGVDPHPEGGRFLCEPGGKVRNIVIHLSTPTRFGKQYREDLVSAERVRVLLHANVTEFTANEAGSRVESVAVKTLSGNRFRVRARAFVLATGGIENARLLLASDSVQKTGLGNEHDLVGRYFMEHPHLRAGFVCFLPPLDAAGQLPVTVFERLLGDSGTTRGLFSISEQEQRRSRLLNFCAEAYALSEQQAAGFVEDVGATALRMDRPDAPADLEPYYGLLFARTEQAPNPDSRVFLVEERDALGERRLKLDWRLRDEDRHSILRSIELIGEYLGQHGWGRAGIRGDLHNSWLEAGGGAHHMGTTRMHRDPKRGVVDSDCRVHSLANLYVGGSSVYPTTGFANPLLTTLALTLRLAEHLTARLETH